MTNTFAISDARAKLPELVTKVNKNLERAIITVNGQAKAVIVSIDELESLEETAEVLSSIPWLKRIELALRPVVIGLMSASALKLFYSQSQGAPVLAIFISIIIGWLYWKKKLSALAAIFVCGFTWWIILKYMIM